MTPENSRDFRETGPRRLKEKLQGCGTHVLKSRLAWQIRSVQMVSIIVGSLGCGKMNLETEVAKKPGH